MDEKNETKGNGIPPDLLEALRDSRGSGSETGDGISEESREQLSEMAFKTFKKLGAWGASAFDSAMKKRNAPGLGDVSADDLAELAILAHEELLAAKLAKDATKIAFYSTLAGILGANAVALRREKQRQLMAEDDETESKEKGKDAKA